MTPLPVIPGSLVARPRWEPPAPRRGPTCSHPICGAPAVHQHHAVGRSSQRATLGHVYDWLELNGELVLVLVDLCGTHHEQLESGWGGCKARLRWLGGWGWYNRVSVTRESRIYWNDPKTGCWEFQGFCKGDYKLEEGSE